MKYLIAFDFSTNRFNYPTRLYVESILKKNKIEYTYNKKDEYDEVLALSSEDYFSLFSHSRPNKRVSLIAVNDIDDLIISKKTKQIELTNLALQIYKNVDTLLVFSKSQQEYLKNKYNLTNTKIIPLISSYDEKNILEDEKRAFRSTYRINDNQKIILSYGNYKNKEECKTFESLARTNPDYSFLFFGINDRDFVKSKLLERILVPTNIQYCDYIPEELYYSAIYSSSCLLLTNQMIASACIIADYMKAKKPIIVSNPSIFEDVLNKDTSLLSSDYETLFNYIQKMEKENKVNNAFSFISKQEKLPFKI